MCFGLLITGLNVQILIKLNKTTKLNPFTTTTDKIEKNLFGNNKNSSTNSANLQYRLIMRAADLSVSNKPINWLFITNPLFIHGFQIFLINRKKLNCLKMKEKKTCFKFVLN